MATPVSFDQQYCPIARGLDLLGDRWTLLIVREVAAGPQRFSDLQRNLPGIAASVLTQRLRSMMEDDVVEMHSVDASPRRTKYTLGPAGQRALPVLASLVRFGMPLLEEPEEDTVVRPIMGVRAGILAYFDAAAAVGIKEQYEIHIRDEVFTINSHAEMIESDSSPDVVVSISSAHNLLQIRRTAHTQSEINKQQKISCEGSSDAVRNFCQVFQIPSSLVHV